MEAFCFMPQSDTSPLRLWLRHLHMLLITAFKIGLRPGAQHACLASAAMLAY